MKTLRFFGMVLLTVLMSVGFTACSSDDDDDASGNASIVGTWKYTDTDDEVALTLTFNSNKTGVVTVVSYENGRQTGSQTENFEYSYDATEGEVTIIGSDLEGRYSVTITATYLMLGGAKFTKV